MQGEVFDSLIGAVTEKEGDGIFLVDTGYVVAWEPAGWPSFYGR